MLIVQSVLHIDYRCSTNWRRARGSTFILSPQCAAFSSFDCQRYAKDFGHGYWGFRLFGGGP